MQRDPNKTVTHIPILIYCSIEEKQGELISSGGLTMPVREFTEKDKDRTNRALGSQELQQFAATAQLLKAIPQKDHVAERKALQRLAELRTSGPVSASTYPSGFGQLLAPYYGLEASCEKEAIEIFEGRYHSPHIARHPAKVVSLEVGEKLLQVQLVLWWNGKRIAPALYCGDSKVAPYVYILTHGWAVCPHCGDWFGQTRPDQNYCRPAHREAHRVARYRQRQSIRKKSKGGKRGTQKTR